MLHFGRFFIRLAYQLPRNNTIYGIFITSPNFASGRPPSEKLISHQVKVFIRSLKHKIRSHSILSHYLRHVHPLPEVHYIPQNLLKEHLHILRFIAEQDPCHFLCGFLCTDELVAAQLALHVSEHVLHSWKLWCVAGTADHLHLLGLYNLHYEWAFVWEEIIMLKHQLLVRILLLRRFHQLGKVVVVGFVRLSSFLNKLDEFHPVLTYADRTREVLS